jgi:hypothetical protein
MKKLSNNKFIILIIFFLAFSVRLYGLNWDQDNHLHPDERFLTMVTNDIKLPSSVFEYFQSSSSPLNPYNYPQYQFFVYGTFPIFLTKTLAVVIGMDNYQHLVILGRFLSALFDSTNIILLYYLSRKRILPSLFYALTILPIQLSHFFAVDTFLTTFILATFTLLSYNLFIPAAITFGLALSSKISAIMFAPIFLLFIVKKKRLSAILRITFYVLPITLLVFRIFNPYIFTGFFNLSPLFLENLETLKSFSDPSGWFPPAVQWLSKTPIIFPLQNIIFFGLGLPITILFLLSLRHLKDSFLLWLSFLWIILVLFLQGSQMAHTMRYFLPVYPFIILITFWHRPSFVRPILIFQFVITLSFLTIYSVPHSRVQASDWILAHISSRSVISSEYWDDPLPLGHSPYKSMSLPFYDPDTPEKWQKINQQLSEVDYLIMSSNRLWASIPLVPDKYPIASRFYQDLFRGRQSFQKLVEINSYPGFRLPIDKCYYFGPTDMPGDKSWLSVNTCSYPGIYFRDDVAEEAFTVYDHPKVLIFKKSFHTDL